MKPRNVGELLLTRMKTLGVENFFGNPGTEFVSVIRGFQELPKESVPTPIAAPHEFLAVSMAYGHYLAGGRAQAVMTHANVGAANALIGLIGASRMNIPIIFIAGMTSRSERETLGRRDKLIHWSQDSKDPGAMFREYVKWEAEISDPGTALDILDRAYAIAHTPPYGPVAIKICRDVLMSEVNLELLPQRPLPICAGPAPAQSAIQLISKWMEQALRPLLITNRLGADTRAVALLKEISEAQGLAIATPEDFYMSFPLEHANHVGFSPRQVLEEADLVLVLDTEVPWFPLENGPAPGVKVIHVGPDPLFSGLPLRSHRADLTVTSGTFDFLLALHEHAPPNNFVTERNVWIAGKKPNKAPAAAAVPTSFDTMAVSKVLSEFLNAQTILINELSLIPEELGLQHPGHYFRSGSASPLGWGVGCALGLSLAHGSKTIIAAVGDGVFFLSPINGALALSAQRGLPFITLILNNGGMASIAKTAQGFYPELPDELPLASFSTQEMEIEKCATAFGGLGLRVRTVPELRDSLTQAVNFCREHRRPTVINAILD